MRSKRQVVEVHVIVGSTEDPAHLRVLRRHGWGRMWIDRKPRPYEGERWGFDNGAYILWRRGEQFDEDVFRRRLDRAYAIGTPYLAVLPDIVAEGRRSLEYSLSWLDRVPEDWPWYLAVQDGMTIDDVEPHIDNIAGIFLGGSDPFKAMAPAWAELAHRHGRKFHYARCGTRRKLRRARAAGADSVDSAFPLWKQERLRAYEGWWIEGEQQLMMEILRV